MKTRISQQAIRWTLLLLPLMAALPGVAEERRVESVGVVGVREGLSRAPREAALENAVESAVLEVARGLLSAGSRPPAELEERLGDLPGYATRYSILEDRGERPARFVDDPEVEREYVVLAAVSVDVDGIADRLGSLGLLGPSGPRTQVRLVIEGLDSYQPVSMLQKALQSDRGVRSVVPVEFSRGRAVLAVASDRGADQLARDLQRDSPGGLQVIPLNLGPDEATLLVDWRP